MGQGQRGIKPAASAATFADVTRQKLVDTGRHLGLARGTSERKVTRLVTHMAKTADGLMVNMESEYTEPGVMGQPPDTAQEQSDTCCGPSGMSSSETC